MMTKETMNLSVETQKFNHAIDLFFDMNPEKRFWILLMLYLGKERALHIVDNIDVCDYAETKACTNPHWHIMASLTSEDIKQECISNRFIWADTPSNLDCSFDELVYGLDIDSHNMNSNEGDNQNIFVRRRWEPIYLMEIAEIFISLSDKWYKENATWAFDTILKRLYSKYGIEMGALYQPNEITKLIGFLLDAKEGSVYNPYSATAAYANVIGEKCDYVGQDFSHFSAYIGKLNLLINNKKNAVLENSIVESNWKGDNQTFEFVVSTPYFGLRLPNSEYMTASRHYFSKSSDCAQNKSIGVYPSSICFDNYSSSRRTIKQLVKQDILDTVILLPAKLFPSTAIETTIVVVNKHKQNKGEVRFIDASDCFSTDGHLNKLDVDKVLSKLSLDYTGLGTINVSNDNICSNDYKIYPKFYSSVDEVVFPEGYHVTELGKIIESIPPTRHYDETSGHIVRVSGLSDEGIDCERKVEQFEKSSDLANMFKITEPVILVSTVREVRPTYCIASEDKPLFVHPNVSCFRIKSNCKWINPLYLCYEISRRAINVAQGGIPHLHREILLRTKVGFPSFNNDDQELILKEAIQQSKLAKAKELGLQEIINSMKDEYIKEVRARKHDMKTPMAQLRNTLTLIKELVSELPEDFAKRLEEYVSRQQKAMDIISHIVTHIADEDVFATPEIIDIESELKSFETITDKYIIEYHRDNISLEEAGIETPYIEIGKVDFIRLTQNIVSNAIERGFVKDKRGYALNITLSVEKDFFVIDFSNNGEPLPEDMDKARYSTRHERGADSNGSGEGGHIVKTITQHYGGDFDIFSYKFGNMDFTNVIVKLPIYRKEYEQV